MKNNLPTLWRNTGLKSFLFFVFAMFYLNFMLVAQSTISGKVLSEEGEALPGATVLVQGTTNGTITDVNGLYKLNAPSDGTLVVSYIGFKTQNIPIGGRSQIDVNLLYDVSKLSEVVVIGYGTQKKSTLTGSISKVVNEDLDQIAVSRVDDALLVRYPG